MAPDLFLSLARQALLLMLMASAPPLLASMLTGLLVSLFSAVTQIQEQTLTAVPKLVVGALALALSAPLWGAQLIRFTQDLLGALPGLR
jgi:flagellar biosynthetic protein FliQ